MKIDKNHRQRDLVHHHPPMELFTYLSRISFALVLNFIIGTGLHAAPGDIQYSREGGDPEELEQFPPSIFPHWVHRINYRCDACHNNLFEMKTGSTVINKDLMKEGKVCSECHNGNEAFDDGFTNCNRCHVIKDK